VSRYPLYDFFNKFSGFFNRAVLQNMGKALLKGLALVFVKLGRFFTGLGRFSGRLFKRLFVKPGMLFNQFFTKPGRLFGGLIKKILRNHHFWLAPFTGMIAGFLVTGPVGAVIGIILGFLVKELIGRFTADNTLQDYFVNPGKNTINESEPGLAAYCALAVIICAADHSRENHLVIETAGRSAAAAFPRGKGGAPFIESFCRIALNKLHLLNADLLAKNLVSRRQLIGDLPALGRGLHILAADDQAIKIAAHIREIIDPGYRAFEQQVLGSLGPDPWLLLGLRQGAPIEEVKSTYRKLANDFHPDKLSALSEKQQAEAAAAFIKIKEAYQTIVKG
jgi:DnaJ like chaperone protein